MQCLSTTIGLAQFSCVPAWAIARVRASSSSLVMKLAEEDQEGRDLHVRVAVVGEVVDDGVDLRRAQGVALDLGAHGVEAVRRRGRGDRHQAADWFGEAPEGRFGKPDLVGADQGVVVRDQQRGKQYLRAARSSTRLKPRKSPGATPSTAAK